MGWMEIPGEDAEEEDVRPPTLEEMVTAWDREDLALLWKMGGFERRHGAMPRRHDVAVLRMLRGERRSTRRTLARLFAGLAPHARVRVAAALLHRRERTAVYPEIPHMPVRRLVSQVGHGALAPVRGSPVRSVRMCPVIPGAPP